MTDAPSAPGGEESPPDHAGVPIPPPFLYASGLVTGLALERVRPLPKPPAWAARTAGAAAMMLGVALPVSSGGLFRRAGTSVLPVRRSSALVTSGPYRFTRNPMYVGFALIHAGLALWLRSTWSLLTLAPVLRAVDRVVIAREESYLERVFGDDYRAYRSRVARWL